MGPGRPINTTSVCGPTSKPVSDPRLDLRPAGSPSVQMWKRLQGHISSEWLSLIPPHGTEAVKQPCNSPCSGRTPVRYHQNATGLVQAMRGPACTLWRRKGKRGRDGVTRGVRLHPPGSTWALPAQGYLRTAPAWPGPR